MKHKLTEQDVNQKQNSDYVISKEKKRKIETSDESQTNLVKKVVKQKDSNNTKKRTAKDFQDKCPTKDNSAVNKQKKNVVKKDDVTIQNETAETNQQEGNFKSPLKTKTKISTVNKQKKGKPKQKTGKKGGKSKKKLEKQTSGASENKSCKEKALEYLRLWKHKRSNWSFQKVRQTWLLQNLYSQSKISDEYFDILLEYLEQLQGKSRDLTIKQAEKIISDLEDENDSEQEPDKTMSTIKEDRARKILQILS